MIYRVFAALSYSLISILLSRFILALRAGNTVTLGETTVVTSLEIQDITFARNASTYSDRLVEDFGSSLNIRGDGDDEEHEEELESEEQRI